jgi:hypothetical protein
MAKGQHCQNTRFDFAGCDFHDLSLFIFLALNVQKGMDVFFLVPGITSFRPLELALCTKHRLNIKSANYLQFTPFCIFHPKVPSKHKIRNIKAFYIYNIG